MRGRQEIEGGRWEGGERETGDRGRETGDRGKEVSGRQGIAGGR